MWIFVWILWIELFNTSFMNIRSFDHEIDVLNVLNIAQWFFNFYWWCWIEKTVQIKRLYSFYAFCIFGIEWSDGITRPCLVITISIESTHGLQTVLFVEAFRLKALGSRPSCAVHHDLGSVLFRNNGAEKTHKINDLPHSADRSSKKCENNECIATSVIVKLVQYAISLLS